jgi:amino acid permease
MLQDSPYSSDKEANKPAPGEDMLPGDVLDREVTIHEGEQKFHKLGWKRLTICLIVEAIALGSLSIPSAFAKVGMVAGVILCVGLGLLAIYTSYVVGYVQKYARTSFKNSLLTLRSQVYMRYPHLKDYAEAVGLIWGKFGYELTAFMFCMYLTMVVGSHALTGTIAWINIVDSPGVCALVWSVISAIILFALALPPTFAEFAILGYIDFVSICAAILITIVATGVQAANSAGGLAGVNWSVWPPADVTFSSAFLSVTNIIFAYSFAICQFSFMAELHTPKDYVKSVWALGLIEMFIYTVTGALVYAFVGADVKSPALLSGGTTVSRIAFGVALPVIFISGSINGTVVGRYIVNRAFPRGPIKYTNTKAGWLIWVILIAIITIIGWIIAEAIPFFGDLLGISSALFVTGFSYYFPALFWFLLVKEGPWYRGWKNISLSLLNGLIFLIGVGSLGMGTYASIQDILDSYNSGSVRGAFTCDSSSYT